MTRRALARFGDLHLHLVFGFERREQNDVLGLMLLLRGHFFSPS
jgi:hypothetical protein